MELYQLRMFVVVAELGHLTHAADRLHVSQPAASAQIKSLEEEFGVALFDRKQSGLDVTPAGAALLPKVRFLLVVAGDIAAHAKSFNGRVTGPMKLAIIGALFDNAFLRLDQLTDLILTRQPHLEFELLTIIAGVGNGEFDAGICMGDRELPNIHRVVLKKMPHRIVAHPSWEHMRKSSWKTLAASNWISVPKGGTHHQMMMQLQKWLRRRPHKWIEGDSEPLVASLVMAGVGLGLMREDFALEMERTGKLIVIDKGRPISYLQFIYRAGREGDPAIRAMSDVMSEVWRDANNE